MRVGRRCFVSNLAWRTSWQDLKDKFRDCGNVVYANVIRDEAGESAPEVCMRWVALHLVCHPRPTGVNECIDRFAGRSKGWGIVEFETPEEVCA